MQDEGFAIKEEDYKMRVPRSQRGGEIIEPLVRDQWFVRMQPLAQPALQVLPCHSHPLDCSDLDTPLPDDVTRSSFSCHLTRSRSV